MNLRRTRAVARKEFLHILRDRAQPDAWRWPCRC